MKAVVSRTNAAGSHTARTENDLAIVFVVLAGGPVHLGTVLELDLADALQGERLNCLADEHSISITLRQHDIHDLRTASFGDHGSPSAVSRDRVLGP